MKTLIILWIAASLGAPAANVQAPEQCPAAEPSPPQACDHAINTKGTGVAGRCDANARTAMAIKTKGTGAQRTEMAIKTKGTGAQRSADAAGAEGAADCASPAAQ